MKLLVDARNLGVKPSGVGMYAYNFIIELMNRRDLEIYVLVDVIESCEICFLNEKSIVTVHSYGKTVNKSVSVYGYFVFVKKMIDVIKPDIFWETNNLAPVRIRNPYGKYIVTIHDVFPLTMPECYKKYYPVYFKLGVKKTIRSCDAIVYNSETTKKEVLKFFPETLDKKNFVSYIIIPPTSYEKEGREREGFFYMGNLEKRKGVDILLLAYDRYIEAGGRKKLYIAGKECEEDITVELNLQLQKHESIEYLGYLSGEQREGIFSKCECFVFPSRAEGFGMPVVEALAGGCDVITSDLPIFKEVVGDYIEQFAMGKSKEDAITNLFQCMLRYEGANRKRDGKEIAVKYSGKMLEPRMYEFLREIE